MSGVNFNDSSKKAGTEGQALTAFTGSRHIAAMSWVMTTDSTTSATPEDIAGVTNVTFTAPDARDYLLVFSAQNFFCTTSAASARFSAYIDDTTTVNFPVATINATGTRINAVGMVSTSLSAGSHTIRIRWHRYNGTGTVGVNEAVPEELQLVIL